MPPIPFHAPRLDDIPFLQSFLQLLAPEMLGNDLNYANIFLLQQQYSTQVALLDGVLYRHYDANARFCGYAFPLCGDSSCLPDAFSRIEADALERGRGLNFCLLTDAQLHLLDEHRPHAYVYTTHRDDSDYIYKRDSLASLATPSLRKKRNRLSRYLRLLEEKSSTWNIETIHRGHFFEMLRIAQAWQDEQAGQGGIPEVPTLLGGGNSGEFASLRKALRYWRELELFGILLRVDGEACGFSVASKSTSDLVDVHYEKCHPSFRDAYPLLVKSLASMLEAKYINREEDLGVEGLRTSKMSYQPETLLAKYAAYWLGE